MSHGARSFAVSVAGPATPIVQRKHTRRAGVVLGRRVDHPQMPSVARVTTPKERALSIVRRVAEEHGVAPSAIFGESRVKHVMLARRAAMVAIATEQPEWSVVRIGRLFNRDHTTVLHAFKQAGFAHGRQVVGRLPPEVQAERQARIAAWHRRHALGDMTGNPNSKLTADAVRAIRADPWDRHAAKRLARQYGVAVKTIWDARFMRTWSRLV